MVPRHVHLASIPKETTTGLGRIRSGRLTSTQQVNWSMGLPTAYLGWEGVASRGGRKLTFEIHRLGVAVLVNLARSIRCMTSVP